MDCEDISVITRNAGPPWDDAPQWVGWWACEQNGVSWWWQEEPIKREGFWLPEGGFTPMFAGMVADAALWWHESKLKRNETQSEGELGDPPDEAIT
jgi:hypothetical protein